MLLSGIQPFTLLDYPGKSACIIFTAGCNFRCGYCHNSEFVLPEQICAMKGAFIEEEAFFMFLKKRVGLLEGVVISGGEPTLQGDLPKFIARIKELGFKIKLDTNGSRPGDVRKLILSGLLDYIAMDIKTSLARYEELMEPFVKAEAIAETVELLKSSGVPYEFRTTLIEELHDDETLRAMIPLLSGAERYFLQSFRPGQVLDPAFHAYRPPSSPRLEQILALFAPHVGSIAIR